MLIKKLLIQELILYSWSHHQALDQSILTMPLNKENMYLCRSLVLWMEEEVVDTVELCAIDFGIGREFEHPVKADVGLVAALACFANQAGPHGVV